MRHEMNDKQLASPEVNRAWRAMQRHRPTSQRRIQAVGWFHRYAITLMIAVLVPLFFAAASFNLLASPSQADLAARVGAWLVAALGAASFPTLAQHMSRTTGVADSRDVARVADLVQNETAVAAVVATWQQRGIVWSVRDVRVVGRLSAALSAVAHRDEAVALLRRALPEIAQAQAGSDALAAALPRSTPGPQRQRL